jgi:hypothetical protein
MLTVARCTQAAVWTQVMGLDATVSGAGDQSWKALGTLPSPREPLQSRDAIGDESLPSLGMECCSTHNLACSQVTGLGHKIFAARVRRETQGTNMTVHGGGSVDGAEVPRMGTAAPLTSLALCYQTLIVEILKDHTVEVSTADLSEAGYKGSKVVVFRLVQLIYVRLMAGNARVVVGVLNELKEVG